MNKNQQCQPNKISAISSDIVCCWLEIDFVCLENILKKLYMYLKKIKIKNKKTKDTGPTNLVRRSL